jgi:hypothetical protein
MIWLNPIAWLGLTAVVIPVAVHLLAHHRAQRLLFPTLRFLPSTRLAAIRRRALEDIPLLLVRSAIVAAAVAACAGPLIVTPARRALWDARLVRAVVQVSDVSEISPAAFLERRFRGSDLASGINQAIVWLDASPPARRELLIAAPLTIGSISAADLSSVPADVGIRFTRVGDRPTSRTIEAPPLLTGIAKVRRAVTIEGPNTVVRDERGDADAVPSVEIVAPPALKSTADAAQTAVLALRVPVPPADHRVTLILLEGNDFRAVPNIAAVRNSWMADAIARTSRDRAWQVEAARSATGLGPGAFALAPWQVLARAADGRPLASAAASGDRLIVAAIAHEGDVLVPTLLRAIATSLAPPSRPEAAEILPIPDSQLRAWTQSPGPAPPPRPDTVERDDRRWLWGLVLLLLVVETWMRRAAAVAEPANEESHARVA